MECIGNGEQIRFWAKWLQGKTMAEVAPNLHKKTSRTFVKNRTVAQALHNRAWMGERLPRTGLYTCVFWVAVSGWSWSHTIATRSDSQPAPRQERYWRNSTSAGQVGFSARGISNLGRPLCPATEVSVHPCSGTGKLCRRGRGQNRGVAQDTGTSSVKQLRFVSLYHELSMFH